MQSVICRQNNEPFDENGRTRMRSQKLHWRLENDDGDFVPLLFDFVFKANWNMFYSNYSCRWCVVLSRARPAT